MVTANDIQMRNFATFYSFILVGALATIGALAFNVHPVQYEPLSTDQQIILTNKLTVNGFKVLLKNGCYEPIVQYIQTSTWSDNYCAAHYKHINLSEIK